MFIIELNVAMASSSQSLKLQDRHQKSCGFTWLRLHRIAFNWGPATIHQGLDNQSCQSAGSIFPSRSSRTVSENGEMPPKIWLFSGNDDSPVE
jgi:hypothetical protein